MYIHDPEENNFIYQFFFPFFFYIIIHTQDFIVVYGLREKKIFQKIIMSSLEGSKLIYDLHVYDSCRKFKFIVTIECYSFIIVEIPKC